MDWISTRVGAGFKPARNKRNNQAHGECKMVEQNKRWTRLIIGVWMAMVMIFSFSMTMAADGPSLMENEIPLMAGAKVVKENQYMGSGQVELETAAAPEAVTQFYNAAMQQKGWSAGKVLSGQGVSTLTIRHQGDQFTLAATPKNGKTKVIIGLVRKLKPSDLQSKKSSPPKATAKIPMQLAKKVPVNLPVADDRLEMALPTLNSDDTLTLDDPLVISFSQPVDPAFVDVTITPDKATYTAQWSEAFDQVTLVPDAAPEAGNEIQVIATVVGGPEIKQTVTYRRLPPQRQLAYDLKNNRIDINQASRYRILSLFAPSKVPEAYRPEHLMPSGTPTLMTVEKDFSDLDEKTRAEMFPYFLSPLNPKSYYHSLVRKNAVQSSKKGLFTILPRAWAAPQDLPVLEVYTTENGHKLVIHGPKSLSATAKTAHDLLKSKQMYEEFKKLMGVDVPFTATNRISIFLIADLGKTDNGYTLNGLYSRDSETGEHIISISGNTFEQENLLGATLAHELFHAFQTAFTNLSRVDNWIAESTAVWAQDYIGKTWNTEQGYIKSAFESEQGLMKHLNTNSGLGPYAMYLFPYYLTKVSPNDPMVIRRIWENCRDGKCGGGGDAGITAVDNALNGKFHDTWKAFTLATLDVSPKDKCLPDTIGKFGGLAPLEIKPSRGEKKIELDTNGKGRSVAFIRGVNACYFHVTNNNFGRTAPAVRFNLATFKKNTDKIYVQSVITFMDGRKQYEDWTGKDERLFCLNIDSQCFADIHTVISCSDSKLMNYKSFGVTTVPTSRCYSGTMVISRKFEEREIHESTRKIAIYTTETQSRTRSGSHSAALVLDLELKEKIHPEQADALDIMEERVKDVEPFEVEEVRKNMEYAMKTTRARLDSETGLMKIRYRVKACRIESAGGIYRSRSEGVREDAQGVVNQWETNYTKQWSAIGLDEKTAERIKQNHVRVDIYFEPDTGKIIWAKVPQLDIDMRVTEQSHGETIRRAGNGYETIPSNHNDTKEEEFQLTFSTDSKDKKDLPMDPVWKAKESTGLWATGQGRNERPINRQVKETNKTATTQGVASETFEWSISLPRNNL